ncbi:MAG: hypothetical protein M0008_13680 [Actinomycetota bacterium]|jgi:hypothetical protein|nr:hypothetical protein [Actinomycetota bacterium]
MGKIGRQDGHQDAIDELIADVEAAFTGRSGRPSLNSAHDAASHA